VKAWGGGGWKSVFAGRGGRGRELEHAVSIPKTWGGYVQTSRGFQALERRKKGRYYRFPSPISAVLERTGGEDGKGVLEESPSR